MGAVRFMPGGTGRALVRRFLDHKVRPGQRGPIDFLVLLASTDTIAGWRVTRHQETPGIGDFIDQPESQWMRQFIGADAESLSGIDGKTGATITTKTLHLGVQELVNRAGDQP